MLTVIVAPDPGGGRAADLPSDSPEGRPMPSIPELPMEAVIPALIALARLYPETFRVLLLTGDAPITRDAPEGPDHLTNGQAVATLEAADLPPV
jgi:hypothetical protein